MMTQSDLNRVRAWLKSRWQVVVPEDWLVACLEWIQTENQGTNLNPSSANQMVYDQWLLSDLRELGSQCLPDNLVQQQKVLLNGSYCLQINSIIDVSTPYYGQLQKVRGTENANVHVSATQPSQAAWEPKAGRMLMLNLTDGTQDVQGMEYRPIPCLNTQLTPGSKVLVHGEVLCRLGVLMLTGSNITLLGGEVEALIETNTQEAVIQRTLEHNNQGAEGHPHVQRREFPTALSNNTTTAAAATNQNGTVSHQRAPAAAPKPAPQPQQIDEWGDDDDLMGHTDPAELAAMEQWEDDDQAFQDMMEQIDDTMLSCHEKFQYEQEHEQRQQHVSQQQHAPQPQQQPNLQLRQAPHIATSKPDSSSNSRKSVSLPDRKTNLSQIRDGAHHSGTTSAEPSVSANHPGTNRDNPVVNIGKAIPASVPQDNTISSLRPPVPGVSGLRESCGNLFSTSRGHVKKTSNVTNQQRLRALKVNPTSSSTFDCYGNKRKRIKLEMNDAFGDFQEANDIEYDFLEPKPDETKCLMVQAGRTRNLQACSERNEDRDTERKVNPSPLDGANSMSQDKVTLDIGLQTPPFTYLVKVQAAWPPKTLQTVQIKAYFATLLDSLKHNDGSRWSLPVKINDGTASLDVDLSDEMLTSLIGFTSQECMNLRVAAKVDKQARARLTGGIKHCQESLIQMAVILHLELDPTCPRPIVKCYRQATMDDYMALQKRNDT